MLLHFASDCTTATLSGRISVDALEAIDRTLTFTEPGAFFTPQFKRGRWDGKRRLFDMKTQSFPAGLAHRVIAVVNSHGVDIDIIDDRPEPPWEPDATPSSTLGGGITLYDDQRAALEAIIDARRGCLSLPTSAGKTEIAAALLAFIRPQKALMIVDRKTLALQTADRLEKRLGERVGLYGAGLHSTKSRVTVATIQALWHHYNKLAKTFFPSVSTVVVDECHSISPKMWFQTLEAIPATVRLGLSATIKEATRRLIVESYLGPIVFEEEIKDLIDAGRAARTNVAMLRVGGMIDESESPELAYYHGVVQNESRHRLVADAVQAADRKQFSTLILVVRIEHGVRLQKELAKRGLDVPFLSGSTGLDQVRRATSDLEAGRLPAVIMSTIGDKGLDLPNVRALIIASGQRSPLLTIQRVGRGVRKKHTGENVVHVLDFIDLGHRNLRSQSEDRRRTFQRKKFEPRVIGSVEEWLR